MLVEVGNAVDDYVSWDVPDVFEVVVDDVGQFIGSAIGTVVIFTE